MSRKKDIDLKTATELALDFFEMTKDLYKRGEIAGSIRRKEPIVHDIDFAVIPSESDFSSWKEKMKGRIESIGGKVISFGEVISDFMSRGIQINLFLCPGDDSWGITLMWATGPRGQTIGMNIKGRNKGLIVNSQGIFTRGKNPMMIPVRTEVEVGKVLGWKYKEPKARGKDLKDDNEEGFFY